MFRGALIGESLQSGATLEGVPMVVRRLYRIAPQNVAPAQPPIWTVIEFEVADDQAEALATALTAILDQPGWYCDYQSASERFVVFPGRFFRYPRDDRQGRDDAQAYGRSVGVPEAQLDWRD